MAVLFWRAGQGAPAGCRFVEVKKPAETVLKSQRDEIAALRRQGLRAGILRLVERWEWCPDSVD